MSNAVTVDVSPGYYLENQTINVTFMEEVKEVAINKDGSPPSISKYIAYDTLNPPNPFISVTEDGAGRVVYDGGFPRGRPKGPSRVHGYRTGDMCRLNQPGGKYKGTYVGRISIRTSGKFDIRYLRSKITSKYTNYVLLHNNDGYMYTTGTGILSITIK